jgi:hypothetical protein
MIKGEAKQECANCGHPIIEFWSVQNEWQEIQNLHVPTSEQPDAVKFGELRYKVVPHAVSSFTTWNCRCGRCGITQIGIDMSRFDRGL